MDPLPAAPSATVTLAADQLPFWPHDVRGRSNALTRSAPFKFANARKEAREPRARHQRLAAEHDYHLHGRGAAPGRRGRVPADLAHRAHAPARHARQFTANPVLTELGWTSNAADYKRLIDCLERLKASSVAVTSWRS